MIFMEDLRTQFEYLEDNAFLRPRQFQLLNEAIEDIHKHGWVHGDLRRPNILISKVIDDNHIKLIDFDWSGKVEQVRYPHYMNPSLTWPSGAESGKIIKQEHDLYWLQQLRSV